MCCVFVQYVYCILPPKHVVLAVSIWLRTAHTGYEPKLHTQLVIDMPCHCSACTGICTGHSETASAFCNNPLPPPFPPSLSLCLPLPPFLPLVSPPSLTLWRKCRSAPQDCWPVSLVLHYYGMTVLNKQSNIILIQNTQGMQLRTDNAAVMHLQSITNALHAYNK